MKLQKNRQTFKINLSMLFCVTLLLSMQSCAQNNETKSIQITKEQSVNYAIASKIINPDTLGQGSDQRKIFYAPFFLKLSYEEAKNLDPLKVKDEFAKLGIKTNENKRFVEAYIFYKTHYIGHKKSCENFAYFEFLNPNSKN